MRPGNAFVFINCPFDSEYTEIFRAICFTIHTCGFVPRCALERIDSGESRLDKICDLIRECDLGIHDISRTELSKASGLPRFNMPFELGLFLGAKRFGGRRANGKRVLVFDRVRYRYQQYLSDLAGQDIESHNGDPLQAIEGVRNWLQNVAGHPMPGTKHILIRWARFLGDLPELVFEGGCADDKLSFEDLNTFIREWLRLEEAANPG